MSEKIYGITVTTPFKATPASHAENKNNPHEVTAAQVGARPDTWMPTAEDVGARSNTWMPSASDVGARPSTWTPSASEVGATPASHTENKNNPHGVTAEQVGARPNTWTPTASDVGARPNDWMPTAEQVGARANTWLPTIAEIGAAPARFGLGDIAPYTTISTTEQLDNCRSAGFYRYGITGSNLAGVGFNFGSLTVYPIWTDGCVQEVRPMNGNCMIRRFFFRDVWSAWEVDNPPMAVGVEYRTTERWNGKPVYQIFLSVGAFTNPIVVKPPGFDNIRVIEMHGELRMTENKDNTLTVPGRMNGTNEVWIDQSFAYSQQPRFRSTDGWEWPIGRPFYLRLKYWKYSD